MEKVQKDSDQEELTTPCAESIDRARRVHPQCRVCGSRAAGLVREDSDSPYICPDCLFKALRVSEARAEAAEAKLADQAADVELGRMVRILPHGMALWSSADAWRVIDVEAVCTRGFSLTPLDALKSAGVGCIEALRARGKEEG